LGHPPTSAEIFAEVSRLYPTLPVHDGFHSAAILYSLLREDRVFTNAKSDQFTMEKKDGFLSYSEIFIEKFEGYNLDNKQRVKSGSAGSVHFRKTLKILKSKNLSEKFDGVKFIQTIDEDRMNQKVCLTSFPHSGGNLGSWLAHITGIVTGSVVSLDSTTPL